MARQRQCDVTIGPLRASIAQAGLRNLSDGRHDVLRAVAIVIRDRAWRAPDPAQWRIDSPRAPGDALTVAGRTPVGRSAIAWRMIVQSDVDSFKVTAHCTALGDVWTNRVGLVILLPVDRHAGARCEVVHSNGHRHRIRLPTTIAPHQPLRDIAELAVRCRDGTAWHLALAGDTFEMEDQRNWLDATFKLYTRPLSLPAPYRIRDGGTVEQTLSWRLLSPPIAPPTSSQRRPKVGLIPALGVATAPGRVPGAGAITGMLRESAPAFVLHRVGSSKGSCLARAAKLAAHLRTELRLELIHPRAAFVKGLASSSSPQVRTQVASIAVLGGDRAAAAASARFPHARQVGGTWADFVQLNRHGAPGFGERMSFTLCPTVHARDDRTLIEALAATPDVFRSATRIAMSRPIDVGPCSLFRRLVPGTGKPAVRPYAIDGTPFDVDPRQRLPIAAAWLAVTIAQAAAAGIASLCAFEAVGARGLLWSGLADAGVSPPRRTPAFAVFEALAPLRGSALCLMGVNCQGGAVFFVGAGARELWMVDLSGRQRTMEVPAGVVVVRLAVTRGDAAWREARRPLKRPDPPRESSIELNAYGIARLRLPASVSAGAINEMSSRWIAGELNP